MYRSACFVIFLLYTGAVWGQFGIGDTIYSTIVKLREEKVDTIIRFGLPDIHFFRNDTVAGLGVIHPWSIEFLVYRKDHRIYSKKFVDYCDENCESHRMAVSRPLEIMNDSIFSWVRMRLDTIRREEIHPYVYLIKTDDRTYYEPYQVHHWGQYFVGVYITGEDICKQINPNDLEKNIRQIPENLNYENNWRTKLRELYLLFLDFFEKADSSYRF